MTRQKVRPARLFLSGPDVCARLGISRWTWRRWVKSKLAPQPAELPGFPKWSIAAIVQFENGNRRFFRAHHRPQTDIQVGHGA